MTDTIEATVPMTAEEMRAQMREMLDGYTDEQIALMWPQFMDLLETNIVQGAIDAATNIVQGAIDAIKWKHGKCVNLPAERWPLMDGLIDDAEERHENEIVTDRTMFERLEASGEEFLGPIETLRYVKRNRSKIKNPIVVLFWIDGRLWCLCVDLRVGVGGLRLGVYQRGLGDRWSEHVRFLVRPRKSE